MKFNKELMEEILIFVQDEVGINSNFDELKVCDLYKFFLVENGCHIQAFGCDFYCESVKDFFSDHLIKFPFETIRGFSDHEKHIYEDLEFQCIISEEKSFKSNVYEVFNPTKKDYFTYIPCFSFIQREKYSTYMLIMEQSEIKELKNFILLCKSNEVNENMCAFECLEMMEKISLKRSLNTALAQKTNEDKKSKI